MRVAREIMTAYVLEPKHSLKKQQANEFQKSYIALGFNTNAII